MNKVFLGLGALALYGLVKVPYERTVTAYRVSPELARERRLPGGFGSLKECYNWIVLTEGRKAIWKGGFSDVFLVTPLSAIAGAVSRFFELRPMFHVNAQDSVIGGYLKKLVGQVSSGFLTLVLVMPLNVVQTRVYSQMTKSAEPHNNKQPAGFFAVAKDIVREQGVEGLFRGFSLSLTGLLVYRGALFLLTSSVPQNVPHGASLFLCHVIAGLLSYPLDTLRQRLAVKRGAVTSEFDYARTVVQEEGVGVLYKGVVLKVLGGAAVGMSLRFLASWRHAAGE